jgi:hypothetical protein
MPQYSTVIEVEEFLNDFIQTANGKLVKDLLPPEYSGEQADYYFPQVNVIAELKCMTKDHSQESAHQQRVQDLQADWLKSKRLTGKELHDMSADHSRFPKDLRLEYLKRPLKTIERSFSKAKGQFSFTKKSLNAPDAYSVLLLAVDGNFSMQLDDYFFSVGYLCFHKKHFLDFDAVVLFTLNQPIVVPNEEVLRLFWIPGAVSEKGKSLGTWLPALGEKLIDAVQSHKGGDYVPSIKTYSNEELWSFTSKAKFAELYDASNR